MKYPLRILNFIITIDLLRVFIVAFVSLVAEGSYGGRVDWLTCPVLYDRVCQHESIMMNFCCERCLKIENT